jgi:hypothetical protein
MADELMNGSRGRQAVGTSRTGLPLGDIIDEFLEDADRGEALDRYGRPFTRKAIRELRWCLEGQVAEDLGAMSVSDVRRSDLESLLYRLAAEGVPRDRLRSIARSVRALYDYAGERSLARGNPAEGLALPDKNEVEQPARRARPPERRLRQTADRAMQLGLHVTMVALAVIALVLIAELL